MPSLVIRQRGAATWQLRVRDHGRDHYRFCRGSKADADTAGARFLAQFAEQGAPAASPATTFGAWAGQWLALAEPRLAPATRKRYRELLDHHLLPRWSGRRLSSLAAGDGLALQRALLEAGLSPATIFSAVRLAKAIVGEAARLGALAASPLAAVRHVRGPRKAPLDVLPPERFARVARVASDSRGTIGDLIRLALATGMRRGELLGLRWADVAGDFSHVVITGALCGTSGERKAPKTTSSARRVSLDPGAADMLRARRLRAAETALAAGRPLEGVPVFPGPDGLAWANADTVSQAVGRALPPGVSLHGLRHAHATALLSSGVNPRSVQDRLGHSDIRTTLGVYGHALRDQDDAAVLAVLNRAFGEAS